jgi:hypothetical protein
VAFNISLITLCLVNICTLVALAIAITRVRKISLELRDFDWQTQQEIVLQIQGLKTLMQKINGRTTGLMNDKFSLAEEMAKMRRDSGSNGVKAFLEG